MSDFQWNDNHIDWLIERFKREEGCVNSRQVQRNYNRRKGEQKQSSQDFRNLMRLVVQSGLARVSSSHVSSSEYTISLAPQTELFDEDFFYKIYEEAIIQNFDELFDTYFPCENINNYKGEYKDYSMTVVSYLTTFFVYEELGSDYDFVFELEESVGLQRSASEKDCFISAFNILTHEYKAIKALVKDESCCDSEYLDGVNHNDFFIEVFSSGMTLGLLMRIKELENNMKTGQRQIINFTRELTDSFVDDSDLFMQHPIHKQFFNPDESIGNEEFQELARWANFLWDIDSQSLSLSKDFREAMRDLRRAHLDTGTKMIKALKEKTSLE